MKNYITGTCGTQDVETELAHVQWTPSNSAIQEAQDIAAEIAEAYHIGSCYIEKQ